MGCCFGEEGGDSGVGAEQEGAAEEAHELRENMSEVAADIQKAQDELWEILT